jgi:hypothetical protein
VEVDGTPFVIVRVGGPDGAEIAADEFEGIVLYVRGMVVGILAPYLLR